MFLIIAGLFLQLLTQVFLCWAIDSTIKQKEYVWMVWFILVSIANIVSFIRGATLL